MLDDREAEAGAAGGAVPGGVDAVEPLEDPVELLGRDADAAVGDADVDGRLAGARRDDHGGPLGGVGDRVRDQVADGDGDLLAVAEQHQPVRAVLHEVDLAGRRVGGALVDRAGDDLVGLDGHGLVERVVALQPRELDDLLHQPGQPLALGVHPSREALHGLGVVGGVDDRVGEQLDGTDRRLQLVAHVGHEVAADRLDPALAGAVLDQGQHQLRAQRRHPRGHVPRRHARALHEQLGLADLAVAAYLPHQVGQLALGDLLAADDAHRDRRRRRLQHGVAGVDDQGAAAQDGEHGGHAGRQLRLRDVLRAQLALADPEGEYGAATQHCSEQRKQKGLEWSGSRDRSYAGFHRPFGSSARSLRGCSPPVHATTPTLHLAPVGSTSCVMPTETSSTRSATTS